MRFRKHLVGSMSRQLAVIHPIARLPRQPADGSWPEEWNRLYEDIGNLLLEKGAGDAALPRVFATRFYNMANGLLLRGDMQGTFTELRRDVDRYVAQKSANEKIAREAEQRRMQDEARLQSQREAAWARQQQQQQQQKAQGSDASRFVITKTELVTHLSNKNLQEMLQYICHLLGYTFLAQGRSIEEIQHVCSDMYWKLRNGERMPKQERPLTQEGRDFLIVQLQHMYQVGEEHKRRSQHGHGHHHGERQMPKNFASKFEERWNDLGGEDMQMPSKFELPLSKDMVERIYYSCRRARNQTNREFYASFVNKISSILNLKAPRSGRPAISCNPDDEASFRRAVRDIALLTHPDKSNLPEGLLTDDAKKLLYNIVGNITTSVDRLVFAEAKLGDCDMCGGIRLIQ